jgi:uncharacterized OsmC-like protein
MMLNGLDLDARRDLAGTLAQDPWEAQLSGEVEVAAAPGGGHDVATRTMRLGAQRVARPFRFPLGDPLDALLAALGASTAVEAAVSLTERGHAPYSLETAVRYGAAAGSAASVRWELRITGEMTDKEAAEAGERAAACSPVHHTLTDGNRTGVAVPADGLRATSEPGGVPEAALGVTSPRSSTLSAVWDAGCRVWFGRYGPGPAPIPAGADQPKQLFGSDRAPSPHEYVLTALAAEALGRCTGGRGSVFATGRIDLRGMLAAAGKSRPAPIGVRDLLVQCLPGPEDDIPVTDADLQRWFRYGPVLRLLRDPHPVGWAVRLNGTPVGAGLSGAPEAVRPEPETAVSEK